MTIHSCNTLFAHNFVPSPYQICSYDCTLIQLYICTQVCTFSLLSNLPPSQFTHTTFYLHLILYFLPIKFAPLTIHSYNTLFAHKFVHFPNQICSYDYHSYNTLFSHNFWLPAACGGAALEINITLLGVMAFYPSWLFWYIVLLLIWNAYH